MTWAQRKKGRAKDIENESQLEISEVLLVHNNIVNNTYQQDLTLLHVFKLRKSFGQLLEISTIYFMFLKTFDLQFLYIEVRLLIKRINNQI